VISNLATLEYVKSTSFGGLLCAGVAAIVYYHYGPFLAPHISSVVFISFFALLGAGLQNVIQRMLGFVSPTAAKIIGFYENLAEITALRRMGFISESKYRELTEKIVDNRFVNESARKLSSGH